MEACPRPRIDRADVHLLPEQETLSLAGVAKALSDPIRVQMVHLLSQRDDLCTCEFEDLLGLAQSKVSYHLRILLAVGVVEREIYGTWSHYRLCHRGLLDQFISLAMLTRLPEPLTR